MSSAVGSKSSQPQAAAAVVVAPSKSAAQVSNNNNNQQCNPQNSTFDISQLPSIVKDKMTCEEEALKRRKTCRFIEEAGRVLKLPRVAVATAMVFFHRFFAKHAFSDHDRFEVAVACIILAAKTEESPKKVNMVLEECHNLKMRGMQAGRISTNSTPGAPGSAPGGTSPSPASNANSITPLDPKGEEFMKLKERILLLERVILHTIGFELSIDHPYKFLVEQIKALTHKREIEYINSSGTSTATPATTGATLTPPPNAPDGSNTAAALSPQIITKMMNELVQYAMNFANDSMHTILCLQFEPSLIATACVFLATFFAKVQPVINPATGTRKDWLSLLGNPPAEALSSISIQILELIADRRGADLSLLHRIRQSLETLQNAITFKVNHDAAAAAVVANGGAAAPGNNNATASTSQRKPPPPPPPSGGGSSPKRARLE